VANSASPPPTTIHTAAKGAGTAAEVGPPVSGAHEQTANFEFATSVPGDGVATPTLQHRYVQERARCKVVAALHSLAVSRPFRLGGHLGPARLRLVRRSGHLSAQQMALSRAAG